MSEDRSQSVEARAAGLYGAGARAFDANGEIPRPAVDADWQQRDDDGAACLKAALEYLALGWSVLALCPPDHVSVGHAAKDHARGCASPGKRPWHTWKEYQDRLPTESEVRGWWATLPNSNLGLALGPVSGLVRIDVDGPAGEAKLDELSKGDLPTTLEFTSGRANGGRGLLYAIPPGLVLKTTKHSDEKDTELRFQSKGGQTVLPPSRHPLGGKYTWVAGRSPTEIKAAPAPAWLLNLLKPDAPKSNLRDSLFDAANRKKPPGRRLAGDRLRLQRRCRAYLNAMPDAVSGEHGHDSMWDACLASLQGFLLTEDEARPVLEWFNENKCKPPWSATEFEHKLADAGKADKVSPGWLIGPAAPTFCNYFEDEITVKGANGKPSQKTIHVGLPIYAILMNLDELTQGWPKRVGPLLFGPGADGRPQYLESDQQTFAWVAGRIGGAETNPIKWDEGSDKITRGQFCAYLGQQADCYDAVEEYPHEPPIPKHFYVHPKPRPTHGVAIRGLLDRFKPATPIDRDLILAFLLTQAWGGLAGCRPGFLFTADDEADLQRGRGAGKSMIPQIAGTLFGGTIQAGSNDDIDRLKTRILTPSALAIRLVVLDNLKTFKLSSGELESLITADVISGHRLFHGEASRPNTLTFCLTINGANLSRDMAQRVVPILVARADYTGTWLNETRQYVETHRWQLIGDLIEILQGTPPALSRYTRWGSWEAGVLAHVSEPNDCQRVIAERQAMYDEDHAESEVVAEAFRNELRVRGHDPETDFVWIPSAVAACWVNSATNEKNKATNKATAYLKGLGISELRAGFHTSGQRGWRWRGGRCTWGPDASAVDLYGVHGVR